MSDTTDPAAVDPQQERGGDDAAARLAAWLAYDTAQRPRRRDNLGDSYETVPLKRSDIAAVLAGLKQLRSGGHEGIRSGRSLIDMWRERVEEVEPELEQLRDCHATLHADDKKLREFIEELADTPTQWRLVAPSGHRQTLPREAVEGGAPWPEGWQVQTRSVAYGEWQSEPTDGTR